MPDDTTIGVWPKEPDEWSGITLTAEQAGRLFDAIPEEDDFTPLAEALDSMRGNAMGSQGAAAYVLIKITPDT